MKYALLLLLFLPLISMAQIVNTERLRINTNDRPFRTEIGLNLGLTRNKAGQTLRLGTDARFELLKGRSRWLLSGAYHITQFTDVDEPGSAPKNFANNAFGHLRYNYELNNWLTWEAFLQGQFDEVQQIDLRWLAGTGPRLRLLKTDSSHLFLGLLYMYEQEQSINKYENPVFEETVALFDHRMSAYLSGGFNINTFLNVNQVVYYQPALGHPNDYRITSETNIMVAITAKLALRTSFLLIYDAAPPVPVPRTMYNLSNGLVASF